MSRSIKQDDISGCVEAGGNITVAAPPPDNNNTQNNNTTSVTSAAAIAGASLDELQLVRDKLNSTSITYAELECDMERMMMARASDGVASMALLRVVVSEVLRLKQSERSLKTSLEHNERNHSKNSIMLNLLQDQVAHANAGVERARLEADTARKEADEATRRATELRDKLKRSVEAEQHVQRLLEKAKDEHSKDTEARDLAAGHQGSSLERVRQELDRTKAKLLRTLEDFEKHKKSTFEEITTLKVGLKQAKDDLEQKEIDSRNDQRGLSERALSSEQRVKQLLNEISQLKTKHLDEQKSAHEMLALVKTELENTKITLAQKDLMISATTKETFDRIVQLQAEVDRVREDLQREQSAAAAASAQATTFETKLRGDLESTQKELARTSEELLQKQKIIVDNSVQARVDAESLRNRIRGTEEDRDHFKSKCADLEVKLRAENEGLRRSGREELRKRDEETAMLKDTLKMTSDELRMTTRRLVEVEEVLRAREAHIEQSAAAHEKEVATLHAEVTGYRQSVRQLESHISENISYRIAQERVEALEAEATSYRNQVSSLNHAIADMKVDAEVVEQYRVKVLQERYDDLLKETDRLRAQCRFCLPLLDDVVAIVERDASGKLSAATKKEIDLYQREYAQVPGAVSVYSV
eukprot:PhM_4_TR12856/c0_g1_i1/m.81754